MSRKLAPSESVWQRFRAAVPGCVAACALACVMCWAGPAQAQAQDRLDELIGQADALRTADPERMEAILGRLEGMLEQATPRQLGRVRMLRVHRAVTSGQSAAAIDELRQILDSASEPELRFLAASMLANTYAVQRQFEDALRALDAMLPLAARVKDSELRHRGLMVAAIVYNQVGEYGLALRHAESVAQDQPTARNACAIASVTLEARNGLQGSFADQAAFDALRQCDGEPIFAAFLRWHLARQMQMQGRVEEAITLLSEQLPGVEATGYPFIIAQYHALLAELAMEKGAVGAARLHSGKALALSTEATSTEAIVKAHYVQYQLALQADEPVAALAAYRRYSEAERAHFNDVKSREMAYQVVRHQSLQQAQQIELLHQKNELLELQTRVTEQRAHSWLLLALMLVGGMASVGYWAYKTKRLQMRLKRMTEVDALTGICNRQYFSERAQVALAQCGNEARPAVLMMFDLDHFKQVNDRFGHAAGDWALQQVTAAVRPLCRDVDSFGRLGGEEFALLLPDMDERAAVRLAADAQAAFDAIDAAAEGFNFRIAASFGIASVNTGGYSLTTLMRQADQAMYTAKRGGRRQVRMFEPALDAGEWPAPAPELVRGRVRDTSMDMLPVAGDAARRAIA